MHTEPGPSLTDLQPPPPPHVAVPGSTGDRPDAWREVGAGLSFQKPQLNTSRGKKRRRRPKNTAPPPQPEQPLPPITPLPYIPPAPPALPPEPKKASPPRRARRQQPQRRIRHPPTHHDRLPSPPQPPGWLDEDTRDTWVQEASLAMRWREKQFLILFETTSVTHVHPAILDENNLACYRAGSAPLDEPCPLSFNIAVALCIGAWVAGDKRMEEEYWRQCRRQAEYLFDTRDYHVATALYRIFEYSAHKGKREQGTYFAILALSILESLDSCNCILYSWLLHHTYLGAPKQDFSTYWKKLRIAKDMPFVSEAAPLRSVSSSPRSGGSPRTPSSTTSSSDGDELRDEENARAHNSDLELDSVLQEILRGVVTAQHRALINFNNTGLIAELKEETERLYETWNSVRHAYRPPQRLKMDEIFVLNTTMFRWSLGDQEGALASAAEFVRVASHPQFKFLLILKRPVFYPLQVLSQTHQRDLLQRLVSLLRDREGGTFLDGALEAFKHL